MNRKARLGKGLDALLGGVDKIVAQSDGELRYLPVATIRPGRYQPRTNMDQTALTELADSIRTHGVVQPIVVRETPAGDYELIAGERRWRAAQMSSFCRNEVVIAPFHRNTAPFNVHDRRTWPACSRGRAQSRRTIAVAFCVDQDTTFTIILTRCHLCGG